MIGSIRTAEQVSAVFRSKRVAGSLNWEPECLMLFCGQPASADDKDKLIGAWKIVSAVVDDVHTHEQKPLYGEHPKGYLILLATGRMMSLLVSEGRKAPQPDEERSIAYIGT